MDSAEKLLVHECLSEIRAGIAANMSAKGVNASGRTVRSMEIVDEPSGATLYGRAFFATLETGRRPGKWPPREKIYRWSIDKKIAFRDDRQRRAFSFLTARKIGREGTELYREGGRKDIFTDVIDRELAKLEGRIQGMYMAKVERILR